MMWTHLLPCPFTELSSKDADTKTVVNTTATFGLGLALMTASKRARISAAALG